MLLRSTIQFIIHGFQYCFGNLMLTTLNLEGSVGDLVFSVVTI